MACVTGQLSCERYIERGAGICARIGGRLTVVHVAATGSRFMGSPREGEALEYLFQAARKYDADMTVLRAGDIAQALAAHAKAEGVTHVVIGSAREGRDIARELMALLPDAVFDIIPVDYL